MSDVPPGSADEAPLFTPEQRRRNIILGSLLGTLVILFIASEMMMFKANGFPKDPDEWDRLQHRSANADGSVPQPSQNQTPTTVPTTDAPTTAAPAQGSR